VVKKEVLLEQQVLLALCLQVELLLVFLHFLLPCLVLAQGQVGVAEKMLTQKITGLAGLEMHQVVLEEVID